MNDIRVTNVEIVLFRPKDGFLGFASVVLNELYCVSDIGMHSSLNGQYSIRLAFPGKRLADGRIIHAFYPLSTKATDLITSAVAEKYDELMQKVIRG